MKPNGRHLLLEYLDCNPEILDNREVVENLLLQAAHAANTRVVSSLIKPFTPQGVSGVIVIEESHLSIHTWPEHGYAAVDFYTCGEGNPIKAHEVIFSGLEAKNFQLLNVNRGNLESNKILEAEYFVDSKTQLFQKLL